MNEMQQEHETPKAVSTPNINKYFYIVIMTVVVILLAISVLIEGYLAYQKNVHFIKQKQQVALVLDNLKKDVVQQQKDIYTLQRTIQQNNYKISPSYIALITSYQLLTTANVVLQTNENKDQALALMLRAQNQIASFPEFLIINKTLANDITTVKNTAQPSKDELILQIKNLKQQITALTPDFALNIKTKNGDTNHQQCSQQANSLQCLIKLLANTLQNIVIISNKKATQIVLTSDQLTSLKLNLEIQLSEVEWAIIHEQPKIYQATLQQITNLLNTYFEKNNPVKNNIIPTLQKLQQINITKPLNIDPSLIIIESVMLQLTTKKPNLTD